MVLEFTKMHALGNDYILINGFEYPDIIKNAKDLAIKLSNRHFGVGGDGIIFALPSTRADIMMRIFNADGSEAEMCGNGIRQLSLFAFEKNLISRNDILVETLAGVKKVKLDLKDGNVENIVVDMGMPILIPQNIPVNASLNEKGFVNVFLEVEDKNFMFTVVSMGNPHAITFIEDIDNIDVKKYGSVVENMTAVFPRRTNVEFIKVLSRTEIKMRVWERGSGETMACGTGACASVVAAVLNGYTDKKVLVHLPGGDLFIEWADESILMKGDAKKVFEGRIII